MKQEVLYLSRADVVALNLSTQEVVRTVEGALREHAAGSFEMPPKIGVHPTRTHPANFLHAMPAYLKNSHSCGLKWVAGFANNPARGLPNVTGVQILNDADTGVPLAIMDCSYLTGLRTAAVSAIAAARLSRPDARIMALAGCGFQGAMHFRFMAALLPQLQEVRLRDISEASMIRLKEEARDYFAGEILLCSTNEECIKDADVIVTCTNGDERIIQKREWFIPGAFGVGIEGGCAYEAEALHQADKFLVDDIPLARYFEEIGRNRTTADGQPDPEFPGGLPAIYATLGEIVAGIKPGRQSSAERIIVIPIGMALNDIALAQLAYNQAVAQSIGTRLPLM